MTNQIATPYDYGKYTIKIIPADGGEVDVSNLVIELNLFESLKDPFVSGTIVIIDSANVANYVNYLGQERIDIEVTDIYNNTKIKKSFAITNIRKQEKTQDSTSAFVISFSDFHMYIDGKKTFSKTYTGKPESVIAAISNEHLGKNVRIASASTQSEMRILTPFTRSPLQNMLWLKERCTTSVGHPFFLHASLYNDDLQLISIDTLAGQGPFNQEPFNYTTPNRTVDTKYTREDFESLTYKIATLGFGQNQDAIQLMAKDAYGAFYHFIDAFEMKTYEDHYSILDPLGAMPKPNGTNDYIPRNAPGLGDPNHALPANSHHLSQVATTKIFEDMFSYNEERSIEKHMLKGKARGLRNFSVKALATFEMPGFAFLGKDLIGKQQIDVFLPKDLPIEEDYTREEIKDKKRSGKYIITNIRNMFKNSQHYVTITGIKLDNDPALAAEQFYTGQ